MHNIRTIALLSLLSHSGLMPREEMNSQSLNLEANKSRHRTTPNSLAGRRMNSSQPISDEARKQAIGGRYALSQEQEAWNRLVAAKKQERQQKRRIDQSS